MRNLRYFGSSNLSPLAPPFTVDRSHFTKPALNPNPNSHSNDPSFAPSISHSTAGQEFFGDSSTITTEYGYIVPDSVTSSTINRNWFDINCNSATPGWSDVNPSPTHVADSVYTHSVEIDDTPFVGFDSFSSSGVVLSRETDYTRELSGLKYSPNPNLNPNPNPKQEGGSIGPIGTSLSADNPPNESHFSLGKQSPIKLKSSPIVIKPPPAPIALKDTKKPSASDQMSLELKSGQGVVQVPDINININIPDAAGSSVDHHNPAEDSPCWKGTPFLPFRSAEMLSSHEEVAVLPAEVHGEAGGKEVNASVIVKELCSRSDLLLSAYSNDALKKHDLERLERATQNLGVYLSRQVDQVTPPSAKKPLQVKDDGEKLTHSKNTKADVCGVNMVKAIKKVLEENLEGEAERPSESDGSLYKALWLEAEAELCCLGYRARFDRLKRERHFQGRRDEAAAAAAAAAGSGSDWEHILKDEVS